MFSRASNSVTSFRLMNKTLEGFDELAKGLGRLNVDLRKKIVRRGVSKMAQVTRKRMRQLAPRRTGNLHKNLKYTVRRDRRGGFTAKVGAFNTAYYAKFLEGGTKPHKITSRKVKKGKIGGLKLGFAVYKQVDHPGASKKPFIEKAFNQSQDQAIKEAGDLMFKLIQDSFK